MRLSIRINDQDVVLDAKQAEVVFSVLAQAEYIKPGYKRKEDQSDYYFEYTLERTDKDVFRVTVIPEDRYNELKFFTAANKSKQSQNG